MPTDNQKSNTAPQVQPTGMRVALPPNYRKPLTPRDPYVNRSFIKKIANAVNSHATASFNAFPKQTFFSGQDRGEEIVLIVRQHPITLFPSIFSALIVLLVSFVISILISNEGLLGSQSISGSIAVLVIMTLFVVTYVFSAFLKWFYTLNIITTRRIIDLDFQAVIKHVFTEARLDKIEDISHKPMGFWSSIFDFGDVYVQTAGTNLNIVMTSVSRPRDVQDTINDLIDMKHKNEI